MLSSSKSSEHESTQPGVAGSFTSRVCLSSHICLSFFSVPSGIIGERLPIRYYLTFGMVASGAFTALFGVGYFYNIHSFGFYVVTQVRSGPRLTMYGISVMSQTGC